MNAPANTTKTTTHAPRKGDYILTAEGWVRLAATGVAGGQHEMIGENGRHYRASQFGKGVTVRRPGLRPELTSRSNLSYGVTTR